MNAGALLTSDYVIVAPDASISIDSAEAWAGVVWRIGSRALRLHIEGKTTFTAEEALREGLIDEIADDPAPLAGSRSAMALDSAALLITSRGGDALERAEFARLFAAGEPQIGLRAFLEKKRPSFIGMLVAQKL
ncbi:MAG TPA: hypothetical protein VLV78_16965 [Thermoanaerobaculia bacterium]|nr:hypothetical protein [Thermoanaerobaculia bacterium]